MRAPQPAAPVGANPSDVPQPARAPVPAPAPAPPTAEVQIPVASIPRTAQELAALRARRSELSDQLVSVTRRRNQLAERLRRADGADRAGLEQHLQLLDKRILQIESDIDVTGRQLIAAPANVLATSTVPPPPSRGRAPNERGVAAIGSLFTLLVLAPLALSAARLMWRRATQPAPTRDTETAQRLARLETAVDTIAVEIERVAEGQRFLTRLLAESNGAARLDPLPGSATVGDALVHSLRTAEVPLDRR